MASKNVETLLAMLRGIELTPNDCHRVACNLHAKLEAIRVSGFPDGEQAEYAVRLAEQLASATGFLSGPCAFMTAPEIARTQPTPIYEQGQTQ